MDLFGQFYNPSKEEQDAEITSTLPDTVNTLDEPVWATIGRDLLSIGIKLAHVLFPFWGSVSRINHLKDWDLWGPFLISFLLASILTFAAKNQQALIFTSVFVIVWVGAVVITINAILLGGRVSFFQTVCALGYCLGPMAIAAFTCLWWDNLLFRLLVVGVCLLWSIFACWSFVWSMMPLEKAGRSVLVLYPVALFYLVISWMVVVVRDVAE